MNPGPGRLICMVQIGTAERSRRPTKRALLQIADGPRARDPLRRGPDAVARNCLCGNSTSREHRQGPRITMGSRLGVVDPDNDPSGRGEAAVRPAVDGVVAGVEVVRRLRWPALTGRGQRLRGVELAVVDVAARSWSSRQCRCRSGHAEEGRDKYSHQSDNQLRQESPSDASASPTARARSSSRSVVLSVRSGSSGLRGQRKSPWAVSAASTPPSIQSGEKRSGGSLKGHPSAPSHATMQPVARMAERVRSITRGQSSALGQVATAKSQPITSQLSPCSLNGCGSWLSCHSRLGNSIGGKPGPRRP